jgi:hypothetical protein
MLYISNNAIAIAACSIQVLRSGKASLRRHLPQRQRFDSDSSLSFFVPIDEFLSRYTREALAHGISKGIGKFNLRGTGLPAWVGIVGLVETAQLRTLTLGLSCQFVFVRVPALGGIITNGERTTQVRKGRILFQTSSNRDRSADA